MQTQEQIQEIARKYGVPVPETCKELDWKGESNYYYYNGELCYGLRFNKLIGYWFAKPVNDDGLTFFKSVDKNYFIPAPQMHEIAPLVAGFAASQEMHIHQNVYQDFTAMQFVLSSTLNPVKRLPYVNIDGSNYAEAYAQMYIKLRRASML